VICFLWLFLFEKTVEGFFETAGVVTFTRRQARKNSAFHHQIQSSPETWHPPDFLRVIG